VTEVKDYEETHETSNFIPSPHSSGRHAPSFPQQRVSPNLPPKQFPTGPPLQQVPPSLQWSPTWLRGGQPPPHPCGWPKQSCTCFSQQRSHKDCLLAPQALYGPYYSLPTDLGRESNPTNRHTDSEEADKCRPSRHRHPKHRNADHGGEHPYRSRAFRRKLTPAEYSGKADVNLRGPRPGERLEIKLIDLYDPMELPWVILTYYKVDMRRKEPGEHKAGKSLQKGKSCQEGGSHLEEESNEGEKIRQKGKSHGGGNHPEESGCEEDDIEWFDASEEQPLEHAYELA
jgi:hypothetical protein